MKISSVVAISDKVKQLIISNLHSNQKAQCYSGGCEAEIRMNLFFLSCYFLYFFGRSLS